MAAMPQPMVDPASGAPMVDPMTGQPAAQPGDPNAMALLQEVQEAKQQIQMADRMAVTLKLLFAYYLSEQDAGYKEQFKALVRRTKVCGVGYVELDFQRLLKENPDIAAKIMDTTSKITAIEAAMAEVKGGDVDVDAALLEELRLNVQDLTNQLMIVQREGPLLSFPRATEIIPDKDCRHLKTFSGSRWVARRYDMTCARIAEVYKVDVEGNCQMYSGKTKASKDAKAGTCRLYRVQDKRNQQVFVVCDGYPDFIVEPAEPDVKIERFWTVFPLVFNEVESDDDEGISIFPPSDVWNARHMQREYNSSRQGLREHKIAARPRYVAGKSMLEEKDKTALSNAAPFTVTELNALQVGQKIGDILGVLPVPGVDPNLYETESTFNDIQRVVGAQQANFGGTSGDTATETSIAEHGRQSGVGSDVDDLDTMLSALARGMGQLMLTELSKDTVIEIVGPGAVWPDAPPTREQVVKDLLLDVEAGSSGRPNVAADAAKLERAMPFVQMLPGMNPRPWAEQYLRLFDIDIEDGYVEGMPSIASLNQMAGHPPQQGAGDPQDAPDQQGDKGGQNAPSTQTNEPQSQPAHPAPMAQPGPGAPIG